MGAAEDVEPCAKCREAHRVTRLGSGFDGAGDLGPLHIVWIEDEEIVQVDSCSGRQQQCQARAALRGVLRLQSRQ
eukprot:2653454-Rhodomonas_salina.2